jgi:CheY-like chemotaxis protein
VTDTGIGIAKKHLPRIFDPYFTTKQKGSGLGLSISYSIIRKHSGYIFVESELGQGTTFRVYLPASLRKAEPVAAQDAPIHKGRGRVLVMDDEPMIVDVARAMLAHLGYDVEAAGDGEAALDAWRKARLEGRPFSAVLMDLTIPGGMGGIETVRRLREADPSARAVVSSGYSCDPVMSEFRRYGFRGVVSKPYRLEELSAVLHRVIVEEGELV